jgi:hypothetical protein
MGLTVVFNAFMQHAGPLLALAHISSVCKLDACAINEKVKSFQLGSAPYYSQAISLDPSHAVCYTFLASTP